MIPLPYLKIASYALVAVVSFGGGCKLGSALKDRQILALQADAQEAREKALANIKRFEDERDAKIEATTQLDIERQRETKVVEKVIINDVIKYVQTPASQLCGLDSDGVRIINNATSGMSEDSETASTSDARTRQVTAARVVTIVAGNYLMCAETANQLIALQDWARAISEQ